MAMRTERMGGLNRRTDEWTQELSGREAHRLRQHQNPGGQVQGGWDTVDSIYLPWGCRKLQLQNLRMTPRFLTYLTK